MYICLLPTYFRNNFSNTTTNILPEQWKNGCWFANTVLTMSKVQTPKKRLTGHDPPKHIPTLRKWHLSFLGNKNQLLVTPSRLLQILNSCKGNNCRSTPLCINTWQLKHHHHSG